MNLASEKAVGSSIVEESELFSEPLLVTICSGVWRMDTYVEADSETISLIRRSSSSAPFFTDSSESAASL